MEMGGVQKVLLDLLNRLDQNKFEIHLLLNIYQGDLKKEIPKHVKLHYLVEGREELSEKKTILFIQLVLRRLNLIKYKYIPSLFKKRIGIIPDVEVAFMHANLQDIVNSPFTKSKKINWFHSDIRFFESKKQANQTIKFMKQCDTTVFVSRTTQANVELYSKGSIANGICIYNIFDHQSILSKAKESIFDTKQLKGKKHIFVSTGRLVFQKGYDVLLDAHIELIRQGVEHYILIIGNGFDYKQLKKKIILENVEDSFILIGQKDNPYPYISGADYYIQPSRYEAYPLALGEALALNKPIISTDVGGVREMIIHNKTGLIVDFSIERLKDAMMVFINNRELVESIKENQKKISFKLHNQKIEQEILHILS
jgi:glycosyltransferase involved in cell wall biosynthesis